MWNVPLVLVIAFVSSSVSQASGATMVTIDINLKASNALVDEMFLSNSMPHTKVKWAQMPFSDTKFREMFKALAPTSFRILCNPQFHLRKQLKKKRSFKASHDEDSRYPDHKDKFTNAKHKEGEIEIRENFKDDYLRGSSREKFNRVRSIKGQTNQEKSDPGKSEPGKSGHVKYEHEKVDPRNSDIGRADPGKSELGNSGHVESGHGISGHGISGHGISGHGKSGHGISDPGKSEHGKPYHNTSTHAPSANVKGKTGVSKHEKTNLTILKLAHDIDKLSFKVELDMSVVLWTRLNEFIKYVGWNISMDFTNLDRSGDGSWNTTAARAFLQHAAKHNIRIPDFQLGNEPNLYHGKYGITSVTPERTVLDLKQLRKLLNEFSLYKNSTIVGPETTRPASSQKYFTEFLEKGGCGEVDAISFHQYYKTGDKHTITAKDFVDVSFMDLLEPQFIAARQYMGQHKCNKPLRLTETSSIAGGLPGVADRFVAGFLWLDKLGVAARSGVTRVYRFNIWGGSYSLLNHETFDPNPDYYLTLLYKRLVQGRVFNVTTGNKYIRAYGNCVKHNMLYPKGSLVISILNLLDDNATLTIKHFERFRVVRYFFTPGDDKGLESTTVKVNDIRMSTLSGTSIKFPPRYARGYRIDMPAQSFGFLVIPDARYIDCSGQDGVRHSEADASCRHLADAVLVLLPALVHRLL